MNESFYLQTSRIEERHWWFRHRRRLIDALLRSEGVTDKLTGVALDLGCGSGGNLSLLGGHCATVVGLDRFATPLRLARDKQPHSLLVQGDAGRLGQLFRSKSIDLVAVCNLLYHRDVASEPVVLEAASAILRPGGLLLLTEPAFPILLRRHDRVDHGKRRYRLGELEEWVTQAGFLVRRASYFNVPSFPPALVLALVEALRRKPDPTSLADEDDREELMELRLPPGPVNRLIEWALRAEVAWIRRGGRFPFGVGAVLLARKPSGQAGVGQVRT